MASARRSGRAALVQFSKQKIREQEMGYLLLRSRPGENSLCQGLGPDFAFFF